MKELFIYAGNRLERLSEKLAEIVSEPTENPLAPEVIVVHGRGMEQWVSMKLAEMNAVCANITYYFPHDFLWFLFENAGLKPQSGLLFEPDMLTFHIMNTLPSLLNQNDFREIRGYLADDPTGMKLYRLSGKLADAYNRYLLFRPEMMSSWEAGFDQHWQAELWRRLSRGNENHHRAGLRRRFFDALSKRSECRTCVLPHRVSVFGVSYLTSFHLEILDALSNHIRINLFLLNPCREYWSDIVTEKEIRHIQDRLKGRGTYDDHLEKGNPLLGNFGAMGREFFSRISELVAVDFDMFEDIGEGTVLGCVQSDMLNLRDRTGGCGMEGTAVPGGAAAQIPLNIRIHSCHGPLREIEVLHNEILAMIEENPSLAPNDFLVMAPDIDAYAPFIHAVFDAQTDGRIRIPFRIWDQNVLTGNRLVNGFMSLLDISDSRFGRKEVMRLLDIPGIMETFGIGEQNSALIEKWLNGTRIKWGIDGTHRAELGLPELNENTWRAGLDRLLLGYAMPGDNRHLFAGILPYDDIEGEETRVLGNFLQFFERLVKAKSDLEEKRTLGQWVEVLKELLEAFFGGNPQYEEDSRIVFQALARLSTAFEVSGCSRCIPLSVVKSFLQQYLAKRGEKAGGGSMGVTFCSMLPLRSIPADVVCLIGMNFDAFPRNEAPLGFDRIAANPRPGDRTKRDDDKYLFLQALMSAEERLHISYVGQSPFDNTRIPPSVVVSDLMDYLIDGCNCSESDIRVHHPLQAFSERYFSGDPNLFSYSEEDFNACRAAEDRRKSGPVQCGFIRDELPVPANASNIIALESLSRFFKHPARFFLQERLGIHLDDELWDCDEKELFELNGLDRYCLEQDLFRASGENENLLHRLELEAAAGRIPHGSTGMAAFSSLAADVAEFRRKVNEHLDRPSEEALPFRLAVGEYTITGHIDERYAADRVKASCTNIKAGYIVDAWIAHIVCCAAETDGGFDKTILIGKDVIWTFQKPLNALDLLSDLVMLYREGMKRPLVFFPETSFAYADYRIGRRLPEASAVKAARAKWIGSAFLRGESEDPYIRTCFLPHHFESLLSSGTFQQTAIRFFEPMLDHSRRLKERG
ncbi:MAG: exodeoxyribonuclease V subunit gamma [Desulfobacterales bacterium]